MGFKVLVVGEAPEEQMSRFLYTDAPEDCYEYVDETEAYRGAYTNDTYSYILCYDDSFAYSMEEEGRDWSRVLEMVRKVKTFLSLPREEQVRIYETPITLTRHQDLGEMTSSTGHKLFLYGSESLRFQGEPHGSPTANGYSAPAQVSWSLFYPTFEEFLQSYKILADGRKTRVLRSTHCRAFENPNELFGDPVYPEFSREVKIPLPLLYPTFEIFAERYAEIELNGEGRYLNKKNPHAAVSWYEMGGRGRGILRVFRDTPPERFILTEGNKEVDLDAADSCYRRDLNLSAMVFEKSEDIKERWAKMEREEESIRAAANSRFRHLSQDDNLERDPGNPEALRYVKCPKRSFTPEDIFQADVLNRCGIDLKDADTLEEYLNLHGAFATYAICKDGVFYSRQRPDGTEKSFSEWVDEFYSIFNTIEKDERVSVLYCQD